MKIILSEYSSGFSDYSWILLNQFAISGIFEEITYLTDTNNFYLKDIDDFVTSIKLYDSFAADEKHKKGSFRWAFNRVSTAIRNCKKRNKYVSKEKPDALIIQTTMARFDGRYLTKLKKKLGDRTKIILIVHDVIVPVKSESWNDTTLKEMYNSGDVLVVHSKTNMQQLMDIFHVNKNKIRVIPHGIRSSYPKKDRKSCKKAIGIKNDLPTLLFYGGIRDSKGLDDLLKALKGIKCNLVISGKPFYGESFDKYQRIIEENHINAIEYIKFTEDSFRDILFQACDYLVLPYKEFYSQSGVFMQAIQYHLPVIATDVSSFREFVEGYGIGFIAQPNDPEDLHDVIVKALNSNIDYEEHMMKAVSENCWEVTSKMYIDLIKE